MITLKDLKREHSLRKLLGDDINPEIKPILDFLDKELSNLDKKEIKEYKGVFLYGEIGENVEMITTLFEYNCNNNVASVNKILWHTLQKQNVYYPDINKVITWYINEKTDLNVEASIF